MADFKVSNRLYDLWTTSWPWQQVGVMMTEPNIIVMNCREMDGVGAQVSNLWGRGWGGGELCESRGHGIDDDKGSVIRRMATESDESGYWRLLRSTTRGTEDGF